MNKCFLIGKVLDEPEFKFAYMSKNISIAYFHMRLINKNIIKVYGYDVKADYIYSKIKKEDNICIEGKIRSKNKSIEIESIRIEKL